MVRPLLIDLFCGAGGASEGYRRAGFDVVGVDISPHDFPPGEFVQAGALEFLRSLRDAGGLFGGHEVAAITASPPCPRWSTATRDPARHPDLLTPTRDAILALDVPYVIENVPGAPLIDPVRLCGSSFEGIQVRRHRHFESNVALTGTGCDHASQGVPVGVYGSHPDRRRHLRPSGTSRGVKASSLEEGKQAMGIDWMKWPDLKDAIPPAYTEYLGKQLLEYVRR